MRVILARRVAAGVARAPSYDSPVAVPGVFRRPAALVVKGLAAGADLLVPSVPGLTILIYHRVGGTTATQIDLATARFEEQVAELAASGRLVSLDEGLSQLERGRVDAEPVVLTFDDGTTDWVDQALPVLVQHQAPATFFVATEFVEQGRDFPNGGRPISWRGLRELTSSGLATIGSHTHTHALLDRATGSQAADEIDRSIDALQNRLGVACEHFAYPKALLGSPAAEEEVRKRFRSATIAGTRSNPAGTDLHRLHRSPIQVSDGMRWFRRKAAGGMRFEDTARSVLNRRRYSGTTT
jgi:peptidoglycan/xylan/chitin deacetylase (PgdA/CDA1 family)